MTGTTDGTAGTTGRVAAVRRSCRLFCRSAAIVFAAVTAYTVLGKALGGHLGHDWAHSALHLGSAAVAAYAGWGARRVQPAVLFAGAVAVVYLGLGVGGWFVDGLFLGTPVAVPLGPADHLFHLLVGSAAVVAIAGALADRRGGGRCRSRGGQMHEWL